MATEKRLIDADVLDYYLKGMGFRHTQDKGNMFLLIAAQPTVDAVEVVRCKDCVNYCGFEHCKNGICDVDSVSKRAVYPYDFCSYGERREGE